MIQFWHRQNSSNPTQLSQTLTVTETTNVLDLADLGITTDASDVIKVVELESVITPDASTPDWYELRSLRNGVVPIEHTCN